MVIKCWTVWERPILFSERTMNGFNGTLLRERTKRFLSVTERFEIGNERLSSTTERFMPRSERIAWPRFQILHFGYVGYFWFIHKHRGKREITCRNKILNFISIMDIFRWKEGWESYLIIPVIFTLNCTWGYFHICNVINRKQLYLKIANLNKKMLWLFYGLLTAEKYN